jgi:hypothetical protein
MERGARGKVQTVKGDTHDLLDEAKERTKAGGESVKRAVEGDANRDPRDGGERIEDGI